LTDVIRTKGITDDRILEAINRIPRHFFLDSAFDDVAYEDRAFPIGEGQTISQPYTVAYQSFLLQVKPFEKVLEIGTGSVYQACVLAELGAQVYTIERQKKLFAVNKEFSFLKKYPNIKFFYGDGYEGLPTYAPFDKVLITAAAPEIRARNWPGRCRRKRRSARSHQPHRRCRPAERRAGRPGKRASRRWLRPCGRERACQDSGGNGRAGATDD